jgi:pteridine reductase
LTASDESPLQDKVALVTGGGTRLGQAIALALGREGMRVMVHFHRNHVGADATCNGIRAAGSTAECAAADLSVPDEARALVRTAHARWGQLDLLVSSAANFDRIPFNALDDGAWERALALNARASYVLAREAAAALRASHGNMVFITCSSTVTPMKNYLPYVVSKAALLQLARGLALELAPEVRVNAVAPGTVLPPDDSSPAGLERLRSRIPLQRLGDVDEIARAVVFLARGPFTTGQQIVVDCGRALAAVEM